MLPAETSEHASLWEDATLLLLSQLSCYRADSLEIPFTPSQMLFLQRSNHHFSATYLLPGRLESPSLFPEAWADPVPASGMRRGKAGPFMCPSGLSWSQTTCVPLRQLRLALQTSAMTLPLPPNQCAPRPPPPPQPGLRLSGKGFPLKGPLTDTLHILVKNILNFPSIGRCLQKVSNQFGKILGSKNLEMEETVLKMLKRKLHYIWII